MNELVGNSPDTILKEVAKRFGTPLFVYRLDEIAARVEHLSANLGHRFRLSYAVKSNPHPFLLRWLLRRVPHLDVSSGGELAKGIAAGWAPFNISYTGPVKLDVELRAAVEHGIGEVVLESVDEAIQLGGIARDVGRKQPVLIRIAPKSLPRGFGVSMSGKPTQFGIDEEVLDEAIQQVQSVRALELKGFHVYAGTQCLDANAVAENYRNIAEIFCRTCEAHDLEAKKLVFGSGLGIPYHEGDMPIDLATVAAESAVAWAKLAESPRCSQAELLLELGRYLVGEAGYYLTTVTRIKESRGVKIGLCDGGMNHHQGACGHLGSVIHRNYRMFKVGAMECEPREQYDLVGPLCTSIDTLAHRAEVAALKAGNVIAISCSGAYGASASPSGFISRDPPREVFVDQDSHGGLAIVHAL